MDDYRDALHHLHRALDAMVRQGDTAMIANIAHPIAMIERIILRQQTEIVTRAAPPRR